jgi:hypothetical protein
MKRRYAVFAIVFVVSLLIGIQAVEVVNANPVPPPWMNAKLSVTIENPANGSIQSRSFLVRFHADGSQFSLTNSSIGGYSGDFFYILDSQQWGDMRYSGANIWDTEIDDNHHFTGQVYLSNIAAGSHSITVYWGVKVNVGILTDTAWAGTSQFSVDAKLTPQQTNNPTAIPTQTLHPSPSETSLPTVSPTVNYLLTNSTFLIAIAVVIVIVAFASILLFFFKNHRRGRNI